MSVYRRKGDGKWVYDFQRGGIRFCGTIEGCTNRRAAEAAERARIEEARQQLAAARESRTGPMTISIAFDRFWSEVGDHYTGTYRKTVWAALEWLMAELGEKTLISDLKAGRIAEAVGRRRAEGVSNGTVNRTVTEIVRRVLRRAETVWDREVPKIAWGKLMLPEPKERIRELRDHEETAVFGRIRDDYRPILAFYLVSGCRMNEAVDLTWNDVDWGGRTITIRGKGGKVATIPLTAQIAAIISPLRGHHPVSVFTYQAKRSRPHPKSRKLLVKGTRYPITENGLKTAWRRHGGPAAGLDDFRLHDLRHTAATRLLRASGNLKLVQKLLRHEDITTTAKYAHANDADLRAAMESVPAAPSPAPVPAQTEVKKKIG